MRKTFDAALKAKVALVAIKGEKTTAEISSQYSVHANQILKWKKQVLERLPSLFEKRPSSVAGKAEPLTDELYKQIGQLQVENDWLKKKSELLTC